MEPLTQMLHGTPYVSYTYSYPHKTAYRTLDPPVPLRTLWAEEQRDALFLYMHIPFCEMRCGFCNLFTTVNPKNNIETAYLDALERQAQRIHAALGEARFARFAIGGGTPTYLRPTELHRLFDIAESLFNIDLQHTPISVETSPKTSDDERLRVLRERGVDRVSIGVQSFIEHEVEGAGRAQRTADVVAALERIRDTGFPTLNIDLMYGLPGQTVDTWLESLSTALRYKPEELYLYPLYVRPLTGLGRRPSQRVLSDAEWDAQRLTCYHAGRDFLLANGYEQVSMRMFRATHAPALDGPVYCCQEDGMVGLGCGARSYTRSLHYSSEYAVSASGVRAIINDYIARADAAFDVAAYGVRLSMEDQRRRYIVQSLLQAEGFALDAYRQQFGSDAFSDLPELRRLIEHGLATRDNDRLTLTAAGLERSDTIGPWLYAAHIRTLMETYELR